MTKQECLKKCRVDGQTIKLPDIVLDRNEYLDVKQSLELIGGKWKGGKISGFVFPSDPTELLKILQNEEKKNLKKEFQFFATPPELADRLVELSSFEDYYRVLEPSAGQGAIVEAIIRYDGEDCDILNKIECFELMESNRAILSKIKQAKIIGDNFLDSEGKEEYDLIVANPPFSKNQDIDHFMHMVSHLKPEGRIASVLSSHWTNSSNKKETAFRKFLDKSKAKVYDVEPGTFKESGTKVGAKIVVFDKFDKE